MQVSQHIQLWINIKLPPWQPLKVLYLVRYMDCNEKRLMFKNASIFVSDSGMMITQLKAYY